MIELKIKNPQKLQKIGGSYFLHIPQGVLKFHGINPEKPLYFTIAQETQEETT